MAIDLLGEMQAALLRQADPRMEPFAQMVDRHKASFINQRGMLARQVVARHMMDLLPEMQRQQLGLTLESAGQVTFFKEQLRCIGKCFATFFDL